MLRNPVNSIFASIINAGKICDNNDSDNSQLKNIKGGFVMKNCNIIFEKAQHKIVAYVERDAGSLRLSAMVAVQLPDGKVSEPVAVQRQKLISRGIRTLEWLLDCEPNLEQEDLETVKEHILDMLEKPEIICETAGRATQDEVLRKLGEFVKEKAKEKELISIGGVFIAPETFSRDDKIYIKTNVFATFIEQNKDLGWSKMEVLKMLKRNDLLETGSGRIYDKKVRINSKSTKNYYVIKMESMQLDDTADETIEIKAGQ